MKKCTKCLSDKPLSEYYPNGKGGLAATCKTCKKRYQLDYQKSSPDYTVRHRRAILKHRYGVSPEWYDETLAAQDGGCAICRSKTPGRAGVEFFSVDHDHETGAVRGLLCLRCNSMLGWLETHMSAIDAYFDRAKRR